MKRVPLQARDGSIRDYALVDDADLAAVTAHRWHLLKGYARRNVSIGGGKYRPQFLHEFLVGVKGVDHVDGNPLNNCRSNLRKATNAQNSQNRRSTGNRGSASRFRGVTWKASKTGVGGKWAARATLDGKDYHLGYFEDEEEAGRVAAEWRAKHMPYSSEARAES